MTLGEFEECGITLHLPHGYWIGYDSVHGRVVASCGFTELDEHVSFDEHDARAISHWLRGKSAPSEAVPASHRDPRLVGVSNQGQAMCFMYSQGSGRRRERLEQLQLRWKLISHVKVSLQRYGRPWWSLPHSLESWNMLRPDVA